MKYFFLLSGLVFGNYFFSQNIKDNKISINYIQLPKQKVDESISTFFTIYKDSYLDKNNQQLSIYQFKVDSAEAEQQIKIITWKTLKNTIKRNYLDSLSVWKQNIAKGINRAKPTEPIYPEYPESYFLFPPVLSKSLSELMSNKSIKIAGFSEENSGVRIEIDNLGLEVISIKGKYANQGKSYVVTARYKMPIVIKTFMSGDLLHQKQYHNKIANHVVFKGKTEYDYEIWKMNVGESNKDIWINLQRKLWNTAINNISSVLDSEIGYPKKRENTEVYIVKKFQDYNYEKLLSAYNYAESGYGQVGLDRNKSRAKTQLIKAINIWEQEMKESDLANKKSRINSKISGLISANLADAYFWTEDFEKSNFYINKAINQGNLKAKNHCKKLKKDIPEFKKRYNVYIQ
ncbi:MAG: Uncharacterised protein [Crocinitomicaceae bacterium]|nr:MAG: Uncharacterised protein [Crocinitomicaceae bacterium]